MSWRQFLKKFKEISKKIHKLVHIYFDILMHNCVQRSFTSAACPGTHTGFFLQGEFFLAIYGLSAKIYESSFNENMTLENLLTIMGFGRVSPSVNLHNGTPNRHDDWSFRLLRNTWPIFIVLVLDFLLFFLFSTTELLTLFLWKYTKKEQLGKSSKMILSRKT